MNGRSRSFGGCATCRSRHLKCDENRPVCFNCVSAGLLCGGYEKHVFFDFEHESEPGAGRFRRPLLTEEERRSMSQFLVTSIPPRTALRKILEVDDLCTNLEEGQVIRGPFTAFKLPQSVYNEKTDFMSEELVAETHNCHEPLDGSGLFNLLDNSDDTSMVTHGFEQAILNVVDETGSEQITSPPTFQYLSGNIRTTVNEIMAENIHQIYDPCLNLLSTNSFRSLSNTNHVAPDCLTNAADLLIVPDLGEHGVPLDAVFLLKHYSTTVLPLLTVFRHTKTPWHIIFIPHVKSCLAALTLGETVDQASLSAFYGTLAISAFSLGGISDSPVWVEQADTYHRQAKHHIQAMLETAYSPKKSAKYKSILIALLTMVQVSMVSGNHDQTDYYLLEAERFIRVKGLNRRKSRKVRLLHHCYAFERIFHETLFINGRNFAQRQHVKKAIELSGAVTYSADSLSFRLGKWRNLETDMLRMKGQEESENDLHLEIPGECTNTMYPEIFGVPEPYLLLLSMIIRLRHEKDRAAAGDVNAINLQDFFARAKSLEKCISGVKYLAMHRSGVQSQVPHYILENMLEAMQHALGIYFYRRIYDVDMSLLQTKVVAVRDCLQRFEHAQLEDGQGSARLIWPAFIAACEAEDAEVQASFAEWFELAARRSGLQLFREAAMKVNYHVETDRNTVISDVPHEDVV